MTQTNLMQEFTNEIETLIDRYGLSTFLSIAGYVCGEKSEHIATQYQDVTQAKAWMKISAELDKITAHAEGFGL